MRTQSHTPAPSNHLSGTRVLAAFNVCAAIALGVTAASRAAVSEAPFPFVWWDVVLVQLACALPLATILAATTLKRTPDGVAVLAAALALGPVLMLCLADARPIASDAFAIQGGGVVLRAAAALTLTFAAVLSLGVLVGARGGSGASPVLAGVLATAALVLAPATYVAARVDRGLTQLGELLEQSRIAEANELARRLAVLDPRAVWRERSIGEVSAYLDGAAKKLEARIAAPLPSQAPAAERLDRAVALAMLGRASDALDLCATITDAALRPDVDNLRGTIHESQGRWDQALASFQDARSVLAKRPASPERDAALVRATTGVAYAQRKLGAYARAEASYQEVLALAPTAESHFLLAQFYEDTQQTALAQEHARRAIQLDPERYARSGEKLINKLAVFHFGCLSVRNR